MTEQHYRLTLADAIAQYEARLITATALVYYYIRVKRAAGWKITLHEESVSKELGIKKSTFYKAIAKLLEKGLIQTEKSKIVITVLDLSPQSTDSSPQFVESSLQSIDSSPQSVDSSPQFVESSLQSIENESPESLPQEGYSDSTDLLTSSYPIFINSLSEDERENFLEFGKKKAAELPKFPTLPLKWIEKNFEDIRSQWFQARDENENQNQKYNFAAYSQAQHQMWYRQLQTVVVGTIQSGDRARLEQFLKDDFYSSWFNWAKTAREDVREFLASNPIPT